jgi:hypothetical protein
VRLRRPLVAALALALTLVISTLCFCQIPGQAPSRLPNPSLPPSSSDDTVRERIEKEMAKKANDERQAQLKRDTDRLLKLATELKTSVEKTNQNTLSVDVVKKAEEIEKLAHSVKEKMKGN